MKKLHSRFKEVVDLKERNRRLALYLLTGTSIDAAYAALDQFTKGFIVGVHQLARFVLEVHSLAEYFLVIDEEAGSEIEKWFGGEFVETRYKKKAKSRLEKIIERKAIIAFKALPKIELLEREKTIQHNFEVLSNFSHPTIHSTKQPKECDFAQLILSPIMDVLVDAQRLYFFPKDSVTGLMFSEFRVLFASYRTHN